MKKKIIAIGLVGIMVICNSMVAWADESTTTTSKYYTSEDGTQTGFLDTTDEQNSKVVNGLYKTGTNIDDKDGDNVPDVDESDPPGKDTVLDEDGDNTISTPTGAKYSVTITWGDMNFTYEAGETDWNPTLHAYEETSDGSWGPTNTNSNKIQVDNNSNVGILAKISYANSGTIYNGVSGKLYNESVYRQGTSKQYKVKLAYGEGSALATTEENAFALNNSVVTSSTQSKVGYLNLKGAPSQSWTSNTPIGTVTIALSYCMEEAVTDASATD